MRGFRLTSLLLPLLMVACAKSKPDVHPDESFSVSQITSMQGEIDLTEQSMGAQSGRVSFQAAFEGGLFKAKIKSGPALMQSVLNDVELRLKGIYSVISSVSEKQITFYAVLSTEQASKVSVIDQHLILKATELEQEKSQDLIKIEIPVEHLSKKFLPIALLPVKSAGQMKHIVNDVGEKTKKLELIATPFDISTHMILSQTDERKTMQLSRRESLDESYLSSALDEKVKAYTDLKKFLKINLDEESEEENFYLKLKGDSLNLYKIMSKDDLDESLLSQEGLTMDCGASIPPELKIENCI